MTVWDDFAAAVTRWRSWALMARQDINLRYKRSVLGPFWISLALAITALGVGLLYAEVFQQSTQGYVQYLAIGLMSWGFISHLISEGDGVVIEGSMHLRSVGIPVPVLAARMVLRNIIVLLHHLLVVIALLLFFQHQLSWINLLAIPGIITVALIGFFLAIVLGPICARYRDVPQTVSSILQLAFLMTPVLWRAEQITTRRFITDANPFYHLLEIIRDPLLGHTASLTNWAVALSILACTAVLALLTLPATRGRVALWV